MDKIYLAILVILIVFSGCVSSPSDVPGDEIDTCSVDSDCVPATCCHATECVNARFEPDCSDIMCTMHCAPGTIDCGGGCACVSGRCEAFINDME
ncbi:MAG: hypothetical protein U9O53_00540 [archaeon]|nr:hypothetical protein [archaeon]